MNNTDPTWTVSHFAVASLPQGFLGATSLCPNNTIHKLCASPLVKALGSPKNQGSWTVLGPETPATEARQLHMINFKPQIVLLNKAKKAQRVQKCI